MRKKSGQFEGKIRLAHPATGTPTFTVLPTPPSLVSLPHATAPAAGRHGSTTRRPYLQRLLRVHSPLPTPPSRLSRVSLPHAAAPAAGRDGMTPSACRGQGESCRYRDMAPRRRPSAAVGRSRLAGASPPAAGHGTIGQCRPVAGKPSSQPVTHTTW